MRINVIGHLYCPLIIKTNKNEIKSKRIESENIWVYIKKGSDDLWQTEIKDL